MNRRSRVAVGRPWRVLTSLVVAATTLVITPAPASAIGLGPAAAHWLLEVVPGITRDGALADNLSAIQDSPLITTDTTWRADAHLIGGEALSFNGTSSVAATAAPVLDTTASFSVAAWVHPSDLSADRDFLGQDYAATGEAAKWGAFSVGIRHEAGAAYWTFRMGNGPSRLSPAVAATDPNALTADAVGRWTHIAASYDADASLMTLYVNGHSVAQVRRSATPWAATGAFTVGRSDDGGPAHFWQGEVIRAYAYDRLLTSSDLFGGVIDGFDTPGLLDAYAAGNWTFGSAVVCYLPEIPDTCNAPEFGPFGRTLLLTLGTDIAADRAALAFDGFAYVFDSDLNMVFNDDGTPATQPSTEYAYVDDPVVHTDDAFSVAALVRVSEPDRLNPQTIVSLGAAGPQPAFTLAYADGAYTATLAASDTPGDAVTVRTSIADASTWHQILAVYEPHQSCLRLYLDGAPSACVTVTTAWDGGGGLEVGRATTGDAYLYGAVDNLTLWQGAVTGRQIAKLADWRLSD